MTLPPLNPLLIEDVIDRAHALVLERLGQRLAQA